MKLSYIIVALATITVAYAGSVTITPKAPMMQLVKKVAESGLEKCFSPCSSSSDCQNPQCDSCILSPAGKKYGNVCGNTCFSPCSSNSDCQDPQCDSCVLSPAGGNVCGSAPKVAESEGEKITITPKAAPITAPLVKETVCHRILQTSIQTCVQEDDPTTCLLPGYGSGGCPAAGFPTCCHFLTISTLWYQDPKCPIAFEPCPKNVKLVKKVAESGLGKCFSPCSSNSDCQDPQCDSCVLSPAGGNVCGIAPKVKNVAAPIMKLVEKNAKFQKLLAVWDDVEKATDGGCPVPGHCGRVYQGCCFAAKGKEFECKCKLSAGDGQVGEACEGPTKAGACGDAYAACCAAYKKKGFPCTCDIALPGQWGSGYRL